MQRTARKQHVATKKVGWPYLARLSAFFVISLLGGLYLVFAPMVNRDFYNVEVLFKPVRCSDFNRVWFGRQAQEVWFTNKAGTRLCGLFLPSPAAKHVILIHHGQFGNLNHHLPGSGFLLQPENALFIYDYAGFGKSEGSPTIRGMMDDARAAYDCLVTQLEVDPKTIVHYGGSLGTGPAALLAAEKPCAGLVLVSPYTSLKAQARDTFPFLNIYPDCLIADADFDTLDNVRRLTVPVLIVHGTSDPCIRIHHGDSVYAAAHDPKTYLRVSNGGHAAIASDDVKRKVLRFIHEL